MKEFEIPSAPGALFGFDFRTDLSSSPKESGPSSPLFSSSESLQFATMGLFKMLGPKKSLISVSSSLMSSGISKISR